MDVVFNYMYYIKGGKFFIFDKIVSGYFYRIDDYGDYLNVIGCGNEIVIEKLMVRKFIFDIIIYWIEEFYIDGFRFDFMGFIDIFIMRMILKEV